MTPEIRKLLEDWAELGWSVPVAPPYGSGRLLDLRERTWRLLGIRPEEVAVLEERRIAREAA